MPEIAQSDFARVVRGGSRRRVEDVADPILAMSNQARSAAKRVHSRSVDEARAYLRASMRRHLGGRLDAAARGLLASFETYVAWDQWAYPADPGVQAKVGFQPDGVVRARVDVVFVRAPERYAGRLLLWDDLSMDHDSAEIIALPCVRAIEMRYPVGTVAFMEIWQLGTKQREQVDTDAAESRKEDVHRILRELEE